MLLEAGRKGEPEEGASVALKIVAQVPAHTAPDSSHTQCSLLLYPAGSGRWGLPAVLALSCTIFSIDKLIVCLYVVPVMSLPFFRWCYRMGPRMTPIKQLPGSQGCSATASSSQVSPTPSQEERIVLRYRDTFHKHRSR